jgi:Flp pilus assembly protein TadG
MKSQHLKQRKNRRSGTGLVEFALVAPVLMGLLMIIIDFGMLQRNVLVISNAAREGARAASLGQSTANIRTRVINAATPPLQVNSVGTITNGSVVMEHGTAPSSGTTSYESWPADVGGKNGVLEGRYVRVTVNYQHVSITRVFNRTISVPVAMQREGA